MPPFRAERTPKLTEDMEGEVRLTSGFLKYPSFRDLKLKHSSKWMEGKCLDDGVFPYWRVHDKLYDLSQFMDRHPGGKFWLQVTQGADITENFESSHFGTKAERTLEKYFVKNISTPRNSPFTFEPNGFYKTLKRKVIPILEEVGQNPSFISVFIQDCLFYTFVICAIYSALFKTVLFAAIAGVFLCLSAICAHNFFHLRDNWRMYIFDMMFLSSKEWRISHVLSHHIFTNTIYDFEISAFEPYLEFLPKAGKDSTYTYGVLVSVVLVNLLTIFMEVAKRIILLKSLFYLPNLLPIVQLVIMTVLCGSLGQGFFLWLVMHIVSSSVFFIIGLTASHHHPEIYHEGDAAPSTKDWGLHQISTTRERGKLFMESLILASTTFGNHTLHHLFPTVDQSKLPYLQNVFLETCNEFGVKFEVQTPWKLCRGFFLQLTLMKPNPEPPTCLTKCN